MGAVSANQGSMVGQSRKLLTQWRCQMAGTGTCEKSRGRKSLQGKDVKEVPPALRMRLRCFLR